ncbi:MAG: ferrous iron transport protein B [Candidatus Limimorpha sp.]
MMCDNICGSDCDVCMQADSVAKITRDNDKTLHICIVGVSGSGQDALFQRLIATNGLNDGDTINYKGYKLTFSTVGCESDNNDIQVVAGNVAEFLRERRPDLILNVVDSLRLEESLQLTTLLIDMHCHMLVVLNNYESLLVTRHSVDYKQLGNMMGFKAFPIDSKNVDGVSALLGLIINAAVNKEGVKHTHVPYGQDLEKSISRIEDSIGGARLNVYDSRYLSVRLLEDMENARHLIGDGADEVVAVAENEAKTLLREFNVAPAKLISDARKGFVHGALTETLVHNDDNSDHTFIQKLDALLTNKWLGLPLLLGVLFVVFQATFVLGAYPQDWIDKGINIVAEWLRLTLPEGILSSMLVDGVVMGVGAVLAFLPNIIILFFFLSMLEDSGYMSRAAFVMDKIMHVIGLHGRSFIPMLIGFGCNVPAIMSAKSIDNKKDRILTMLMIPFMSCSARLPVYMLFVSAFFSNYKALVMMSIYIIGIVFSIVFAFVMKRTRYFRQEENDYVSELPPFRKPTWRNTGAHIWERTSDYLKKISTVILASSVIIWALEFFPADATNRGEYKEKSYLAMVGRAMEPVMRPIGFDWKMNVCILTGLPAKEAIVSTMGILYHVDEEKGFASLVKAMREDVYTDGPRAGQYVFTPAVSWAFMVFVLLYFPCIATISTLRREAGRKWAVFTVINSLVLAWISAFAIFQIFG